MEKIYKDSLRYHKKHRGKLAVQSKVPLKTGRDLSLAYTPGVGQVSREIGKNKKLAALYTLKGNSVAVVSDGSAILGLGNLGAHAAIPVMEGKAILFKEFANIDAFPICLDTQDTEEIIKAVKYIAPVFGGINLEDIAAPRCFEIERRLIAELDIPVMHDDQHGTATVVLAGLINALELKKMNKRSTRIVLNGAGAAGIAIAKILVSYGFRRLILCDSKGVVHKGRKDLPPEKAAIVKLTNPGDPKTLEDALAGADVFIGVSKANLLTVAMVKTMAPKPVIFALSNPVPEIMPDKALAAGAFIVATGRSDFPNQINNVLAFPGIFRGALDNKVRKITQAMFIRAAENLARHVKKPSPTMVLPLVFDRGVAKAVAKAIC